MSGIPPCICPDQHPWPGHLVDCPRRPPREAARAQHFYVYKFVDGKYIYMRTTGTEDAAKEWVAKYGPRAVYLVDHTIRGAFY